jgi:hypothetical protein
MSNIGDPVGPFTISGSFIMFHNHRLDPASKGRYLMRLPDRTLVWLDDYEQRLREFQPKPVSAPLRDEKDC